MAESSNLLFNNVMQWLSCCGAQTKSFSCDKKSDAGVVALSFCRSAEDFSSQQEIKNVVKCSFFISTELVSNRS